MLFTFSSAYLCTEYGAGLRNWRALIVQDVISPAERTQWFAGGLLLTVTDIHPEFSVVSLAYDLLSNLFIRYRPRSLDCDTALVPGMYTPSVRLQRVWQCRSEEREPGYERIFAYPDHTPIRTLVGLTLFIRSARLPLDVRLVLIICHWRNRALETRVLAESSHGMRRNIQCIEGFLDWRN